MNNLLILITLFINLNLTVIDPSEGLSFQSTTIDYGKILISSDGKRQFDYTNTNKKSVFITSSKPSCGCVVIKYNENEIKKGESGVIEVYYDTRRLGKFTKTITLTTSNSDKEIVLTIKGEVVNN
ncbi:hypothetical protein GCM10022389_17580 [Flavobacterium cheonanense]|uniref:DUF1573 domain-containing protein n=1 Tax=Flavobacterium cheonanense TaxID=706183 RepID=A0ABP7VQZ4_9FLAO